jgi:hypothetical protein
MKGGDIMAVDGTYNITMTSPMGPMQAKLTLKSDGNSLSGTMATPMGTDNFTGTINGKDLQWTAQATTPMGSITFKVKATIDGDRIKGESASAFGVSTFEGTKT